MTTKDKNGKETMEGLEKRMEERVTKAVTTWTTIFIQAAIVFGITIVVLKFLWAWVVPDLFPGAVAEGLIRADLTWLTSLKFAILVSVLTGVNDSLKEAFAPQK